MQWLRAYSKQQPSKRSILFVIHGAEAEVVGSRCAAHPSIPKERVAS